MSDKQPKPARRYVPTCGVCGAPGLEPRVTVRSSGCGCLLVLLFLFLGGWILFPALTGLAVMLGDEIGGQIGDELGGMIGAYVGLLAGGVFVIWLCFRIIQVKNAMWLCRSCGTWFPRA